MRLQPAADGSRADGDGLDASPHSQPQPYTGLPFIGRDTFQFRRGLMPHGADRPQLTPSLNSTTQLLPAGPATRSKASRSREEAMPSQATTDITRIVLFVLLIGVLLAGSAWTLLPFLSGMVWASTIAVATWPVLLRLQRLTGGRRSLAVAIMTLLVLLVFMVPFALAINTLLEAADASPAVMNDFLTHGLGPPPAGSTTRSVGESQTG